MQLRTIQYRTSGTCCQLMQVVIDEENKINDVAFYGGCGGNLKGIRSLIIGLHIDSVISKLKGIDCGGKGTSCPDQLANCLIEYKNSISVQS